MPSGGQAPIRWGVIGTANIAARAFLPALRAAGGRAVVVGSRTADRATDWAEANGVERGGSYRDVVDADDIDAVYVALPNEQHATWAAAACAAGRAVLCEKPLTLDEPGAARLVAAVGPDALLWESFVFPFHPQTAVVQGLIADGRIGEPREIHSEFHFTVGRPDNIRLSPEHGGGALYDVGCYPVRLARLLLGTEPVRAAGAMSFGAAAVDLDVAAVVDFAGGGGRLVLSAGMRRPPSTFTRIAGSDAELRVSNPFHPAGSDTLELWVRGACAQTWTPAGGTAFQHAIEHIHRVLRGDERPRHRAGDDSIRQARALDLIRAATTPEATAPEATAPEATAPQATTKEPQ
ncbi:MAG TPA: Gfo/Idh/MocA family oxidoreductase [Rugosimonospora sp.]|jgi:predicted dehydrogenase